MSAIGNSKSADREQRPTFEEMFIWAKRQAWKSECFCIRHRVKYQLNLAHAWADGAPFYFHYYDCPVCES